MEQHNTDRDRKHNHPDHSRARISTESRQSGLYKQHAEDYKSPEASFYQPSIDREWYAEDSSTTMALSGADLNPISSFRDRTKKRVTAWQAQINRDTDRWEQSRLRTMSGLAQHATLFNPMLDDDHNTSQTQLLSLDAAAPFMALGTKYGELTASIPGVYVSKKVTNTPRSTTHPPLSVLPVKDSTSDMAVLCRQGSSVLRQLRERREQALHMRTLSESIGSDEVNNNTTARTAKKVPEEEDKQLSRQRIFQQRTTLPAFAVRRDLLKLIRENQVVVIVGETGSGKTTQLTQYLHEDGYTKGGMMIACTQPRRVAAMSVAKRVSEELDCRLGGLVGYAIRFEDCTGPDTRIKYMTDGVLLRETLRDSDVDKYSVVIIDEAHERSLQTDVLLGLLRKVISRRRDLRLIVTSATMNAEKFSDFFGSVPVFTIPGRTHPVQVVYSKSVCEDYVDASVRQALSLHLSQPVEAGDILVFMTGQEDIEATCELLSERVAVARGGAPPLLILPIYSQLPSDLQGRIFEKAPHGSRKCVVATNIAETSLTLEGITFVIDSGYTKVKVYNPRIGMDALQVVPISQAGANQRSGRAGRTAPGIAFRMYTDAAYRCELLPNNIPEIQRTNLANVVLLLKSLGIKSVLEFDFMDPPPLDLTLTSMYQLWSLKALDDEGELTKLGHSMVEFPLDPVLSKMILTAVEESCTEEILTLVSMLSVPNVFYRPKERAEEADAARDKFIVPLSDHLTLLNVYGQWVSHGQRDSWCTTHYIHPKSLHKARDVRSQLSDILKDQLKINIASKASHDGIRRCIATASILKASRMKSINEYVNLRTGMPCHLHPTSALSGLGYTPEYVCYHELVMTSKEYMQCVTAIDPAWLASASPTLYVLRTTEHGVNASARRCIVDSGKDHKEDTAEKTEESTLISEQKPMLKTVTRHGPPKRSRFV